MSVPGSSEAPLMRGVGTAIAPGSHQAVVWLYVVGKFVVVGLLVLIFVKLQWGWP